MYCFGKVGHPLEGRETMGGEYSLRKAVLLGRSYIISLRHLSSGQERSYQHRLPQFVRY
jgi:hypothetical protein